MLTTLFNILVHWVQLPGILLLLFLSGLLLLRWAKTAAYFFLILATALLYGLSTPWVASHLARHLEQQYPAFFLDDFHQHAKEPLQAIVVLGGGRRYAPEEGGEAVSTSTLLRTDYAAYLQAQTQLPIFAIGAGPALSNEQQPEAALMKQVLQRKRVPQDIFLEVKSSNTYENALYAEPLLKHFGITRFLLVTSASHMPRAMAFFKAVGLSPTPAPTDFLAARAPANTLDSWMPSASMLFVSARVWHEYLAGFRT